MANTFIKATKVVRTALGVLERETVLPNLVWRDAGGDFAGAYGDTISLRVPAYTMARTRTLRAGTPIQVDELTETKVDVTLDTDVYKGINVSDENLSRVCSSRVERRARNQHSRKTSSALRQCFELGKGETSLASAHVG